MKFFDRLLTIVITATITSIIWIVFGSAWLEMAEDQAGTDQTPSSQDENIPQPSLTPAAPPIADPSPTDTLSEPETQPTEE